MKTYGPILAVAIVLSSVLIGAAGFLCLISNESLQSRNRVPSESLIFDLRQHSGGMNFRRQLYFDVEAKAGDRIGGPFTLKRILNRHRVSVHIDEGVDYQSSRGEKPGGDDVMLSAGEQLESWTRTICAGTRYTLRISELPEVPVIRPDRPEVVAAIVTHANVTKDDAGTIQEVGPPGTVGHLEYVKSANADEQWQDLDDDDLQNLAKLNNLRRLTAVGESVTDSGAVYLQKMRRLVYLDLHRTKITDAALQHLSHLDRLESLDLSETAVGDSGLQHLSGLTRLESLNLSTTNVTDEGIKTLIKFKTLKQLSLSETAITPVGYWELHQALPQCFPEGTCAHFWGTLQKSNTSVGPKQLALETGEREKTLFRLLLLGCNLRANTENQVDEATVPYPASTIYGDAYHPKRQRHEAIRLLATLGTVEKLSIYGCLYEPDNVLDKETAALLQELHCLNDLNLNSCLFADAGWAHVAELTQLRRLNLAGTKIYDSTVKKLHKAMPHCRILGVK